MSYITYEVRVYSDGTKHWYLNGKRHREDGPAIEYSDGSKHWYLNGECHREDGPAFEYPDGTKYWCLNGELHREEDWKKQLQLRNKPDLCDGKVVEIEGTKYRLSII